MTPLHRLERRLLRECATWLLRARFIFRHPSDVGEATHGFLLTNYLEAAASLAEEYRDLRDARRILLDMAAANARAEKAERAADERWIAAMETADWDGGVFHHDGRIYPWPRGFVPDCPATWAEQTRPFQERAEKAEAALEDAECRESSSLSARDLTIRDLREQVKELLSFMSTTNIRCDACCGTGYWDYSVPGGSDPCPRVPCQRLRRLIESADPGLVFGRDCPHGIRVGSHCSVCRALLVRTAPKEGTSDDDILSRHMADVTRGHKFTPMTKAPNLDATTDPRAAQITTLSAELEAVKAERDACAAEAERHEMDSAESFRVVVALSRERGAAKALLGEAAETLAPHLVYMTSESVAYGVLTDILRRLHEALGDEDEHKVAKEE